MARVRGRWTDLPTAGSRRNRCRRNRQQSCRPSHPEWPVRCHGRIRLRSAAFRPVAYLLAAFRLEAYLLAAFRLEAFRLAAYHPVAFRRRLAVAVAARNLRYRLAIGLRGTVRRVIGVRVLEER